MQKVMEKLKMNMHQAFDSNVATSIKDKLSFKLRSSHFHPCQVGY